MEVFSAPRAGNETLQRVSGKVWELAGKVKSVGAHWSSARMCVCFTFHEMIVIMEFIFDKV